MFREIIASLKRAYQLADETLDEYSRDRGELVAAGLAFYTLLSMAPLVIIAVAIAGAVLGNGQARAAAYRTISDAMGTTAADAVNAWVEQASESGGLASLIGGALILFTASRLGAQLRVALNQVWNVDAAHAEGFRASIKDYVQRRLSAFVLVLASGPLLLIVALSRTLLTGFHQALFGATPTAGVLVQVSQMLLSVLLVALISAVIFKVVPDTKVGWYAVLTGGFVTSLLFNIGNFLVGLYLARATVAQTYGAAGSAVVLLLWCHFAAQFFLFGAEFTQVYARHYGRGLKPDEERELADIERVAADPDGESEHARETVQR